MVTKKYIPEYGDVIWLEFDPQAGREQSGRRPAVVISPSNYNKAVSLALVCPITSRSKNYPFEVKLPDDGKIKGVILADHVKNIDWNCRNAKFITKISSQVMAEIVEKIDVIIKHPR